jgi:hypothetical protein
VTHPFDVLRELFAQLGPEVPGGCEDCDAYQTGEEVDGIFMLQVHHDDDCPTLLRKQRRKNARR